MSSLSKTKEQIAYKRVNIYSTEKIDADEICELIKEEAREFNGQIMIGDIVYKIVEYIEKKGDNNV